MTYRTVNNIGSPFGLHARPASLFVHAAAPWPVALDELAALVSSNLETAA
jgi:hypothetical protein